MTESRSVATWACGKMRGMRKLLGAKNRLTIVTVNDFMGVSYVKAYQLCTLNMCSFLYVNYTSLQVSFFFFKDQILSRLGNNQSTWVAIVERLYHISE